MTDLTEYTQAVLAEFTRAIKNHPEDHTTQHSASLILQWAIGFHQDTFSVAAPGTPNHQSRHLTQIAALALRALHDAQLPIWEHTDQPSGEA